MNKIEYNLQIWQENICHTNRVAIKDVINKKKVKEKKRLLEGIVDITVPVKVVQASSLVDLAGKYIWAMNNADLDTAKKL